MITKKTHRGGYSLVEVLVAIAILMLSIAGPLTIASKGLQSAYFARDQVTAYMLAQEGIEMIVATRNRAALSSIDSGNLNWTWNWVSHSNWSDCFASAGCNVDVQDATLGNNIVSCGDIDNCRLDFDETTNNRARYYIDITDDATDSVYTRVITLEEVVPGQEVRVTSVVTWTPAVFGAEQSIILTTSLFNLYGS